MEDSDSDGDDQYKEPFTVTLDVLERWDTTLYTGGVATSNESDDE